MEFVPWGMLFGQMRRVLLLTLITGRTNTAEAPVQIKMHSGGNSVMFWGFFSKHGTGPGRVDQYEYLSILKDELIPEFNRAKQAIPGTWRLMQDNAPCHTAKSVKSFLARKRVQLIEWPPYSPDLNAIKTIGNG